MKRKTALVFEIKLAGFKIEMTQQAGGLFRVRYGMQVRKDLNYTTAAEELGHCIMHALCCEGKIEVSDDD